MDGLMPTQAKTEPLMLIGGLSKSTRTHIDTIRYYERIGLLAPPRRTEGRHRVYTREHVRKLSFIRRARELGFSLNDIRALIQLRHAGDKACLPAREMALRHLAEVQEKIASLRNLESALKTATACCNPGAQASCPIIDALSV